ncbi:MAG: hypothetical protein AAB551_03140 [Patescibacteria group bacterium]
MKTNTGANIVEYIRKHKQSTAKELVESIQISPQALFRQLKKLQEKNKIYKVGTPPKVFYFLKEEVREENIYRVKIEKKLQKIIDTNYLFITPTGELKQGFQGLEYWCKRTNQPLEKTAKEYVETLRKYNTYKKSGVVDGTKKLKTTFSHTTVNKLFYLDFYSIERFGKTKLGQLLLYAKQSQNRKFMRELTESIGPTIHQCIKKWKINAVGFIPPTVKREVQFMRELEKNLNLKTEKINIVKLKTEIAVPQKTLSKLEDRIENAQKTMIVESRKQYKNILLIDDAVGSGSTINETAKQIKAKGLCKGKIIGLAITGSFKGFDVISEV